MSVLVSLVWIVASLSLLFFNTPILQYAIVMILGYLVARLSCTFSESLIEDIKTGIYLGIYYNLDDKEYCSEYSEETKYGDKIISYNVVYSMDYELIRSLGTEKYCV